MKRIFTNSDVLTECSNILHVFEILLITPFTNAKVERTFSRMARVKCDWRNRLGRDRLDCLLQIGEEGPSIEEFSPDEAIEKWLNDKVRWLNSSSHKYPEKRKRNNERETVDIAALTLSDLENDSTDNDDTDENALFL